MALDSPWKGPVQKKTFKKSIAQHQSRWLLRHINAYPTSLAGEKLCNSLGSFTDCTRLSVRNTSAIPCMWAPQLVWASIYSVWRHRNTLVGTSWCRECGLGKQVHVALSDIPRFYLNGYWIRTPSNSPSSCKTYHHSFQRCLVWVRLSTNICGIKSELNELKRTFRSHKLLPSPYTMCWWHLCSLVRWGLQAIDLVSNQCFSLSFPTWLVLKYNKSLPIWEL